LYPSITVAGCGFEMADTFMGKGYQASSYEILACAMILVACARIQYHILYHRICTCPTEQVASKKLFKKIDTWRLKITL
jgi:hypothetical protein